MAQKTTIHYLDDLDQDQLPRRRSGLVSTVPHSRSTCRRSTPARSARTWPAGSSTPTEPPAAPPPAPAAAPGRHRRMLPLHHHHHHHHHHRRRRLRRCRPPMAVIRWPRSGSGPATTDTRLLAAAAFPRRCSPPSTPPTDLVRHPHLPQQVATQPIRVRARWATQAPLSLRKRRTPLAVRRCHSVWVHPTSHRAAAPPRRRVRRSHRTAVGRCARWGTATGGCADSGGGRGRASPSAPSSHRPRRFSRTGAIRPWTHRSQTGVGTSRRRGHRSDRQVKGFGHGHRRARWGKNRATPRAQPPNPPRAWVTAPRIPL